MGRTRSKAELQALLDEQIRFLKVSADAYDRGFSSECKRLATTIRVLVHDTEKSISLLAQLGRKEANFCDTAAALDLNSANPYLGLTSILLVRGDVHHVPVLDSEETTRWVAFSEWWERVIFKDLTGYPTSRADLVLTMANQDGGAHVKPDLDEAYARLTADNSLGLTKGGQQGQTAVLGAERAAVRQIAHEMLRTLEPDYSDLQPAYPTPHAYVSNVSFVTSNRLPTQTHPLKATTRANEPCPCGSGALYKACHGLPAKD